MRRLQEELELTVSCAIQRSHVSRDVKAEEELRSGVSTRPVMMKAVLCGYSALARHTDCVGTKLTHIAVYMAPDSTSRVMSLSTSLGVEP